MGRASEPHSFQQLSHFPGFDSPVDKDLICSCRMESSVSRQDDDMSAGFRPSGLRDKVPGTTMKVSKRYQSLSSCMLQSMMQITGGTGSLRKVAMCKCRSCSGDASTSFGREPRPQWRLKA